MLDEMNFNQTNGIEDKNFEVKLEHFYYGGLIIGCAAFSHDILIR